MGCSGGGPEGAGDRGWSWGCWGCGMGSDLGMQRDGDSPGGAGDGEGWRRSSGCRRMRMVLGSRGMGIVLGMQKNEDGPREAEGWGWCQGCRKGLVPGAANWGGPPAAGSQLSAPPGQTGGVPRQPEWLAGGVRAGEPHETWSSGGCSSPLPPVPGPWPRPQPSPLCPQVRFFLILSTLGITIQTTDLAVELALST